MRRLIIKIERNENILLKLLRIFGVLISIVCCLWGVVGDVEYPFWVLTIVYSLGMILTGSANMIKNTPGMMTLNVVLFCKYSILPLALYISGDLSVFCKGYRYINYALVLMIIELVGVFLTIKYTGTRHRLKYANFQQPEIKRLFRNRYVKLIAVAILLTMFVLVLRYPQLVGGLNLIVSGSVEGSSSIPGWIELFWDSSATWIYLYMIYILKKYYEKGHKVGVSLLVISCGYLLLTFIGQTTISRWYTVVSYIAVVFFIKSIFPKMFKRFLLCSSIPVVVLLVLVSIYKNTDFLMSGESLKNSMTELFDSTILDAYLSGPVCVNNAIYLYQTGEGNFFSIFFDAIRNMPIINHIVDTSHSTVKLYAKFMGRKDQIIPLVGQSLIYFGPLFSPVLGCVAVWIIRKFDECYMKCANTMVFVYAYGAIWTGVIFVLNFTIYASGFYSVIIPLMVLIFATTKNAN